MRFLQRERQTLNELCPGLDDALAASPLSELESSNSAALDAFKAAGGPALLVPGEHAGTGADAVAAVRVQRAVASRSPSLAIATTMHHFSVASLVETSTRSIGFEWMLLEAIARDSLLTASIALPAGTDGAQLAVALVPKGTPGVEVRPFWNSFVLAGAESDEVVLTDVEIPMDLVVPTDVGPDQQLDDLQTTGFLWFELLMIASYTGIASALVERVLTAAKADAGTRAELAVEIESVMLGVEGIAAALSRGHAAEQAFADALVCRYAAQDAIGRVVRRSVETLGGMAYIGSSDIAYLAAASAALAFHPPSRARMTQPLCDYFAGAPLRVG